MNIKKEKIEKIIRECDKHLQRISYSTEQMKTFMPLDGKHYQKLSELEIQIIDQFLFRFAKLQDRMGDKLFKALLSYLDENIESKPFIDILNRMEKLNILSSVDQWRELRDIRNELSHHYDDEPVEMALAINMIYSRKDDLIIIYNNIKQYYKGLRIS